MTARCNRHEGPSVRQRTRSGGTCGGAQTRPLPLAIIAGSWRRNSFMTFEHDITALLGGIVKAESKRNLWRATEPGASK
jgi:hypothetical protein